MKIKYNGDKYGQVHTVLPSGRFAVSLTALDSEKLAQLYLDLVTLPQPNLRNGEKENLARLVHFMGQERYGHLFIKQVAIQFGNFICKGKLVTGAAGTGGESVTK